MQDPTQQRITEAALERPFYLLWQEAARRQIAPVFERLEQQNGGKASRLLAEAAAGRFYDLLWEEMKGRSSERGGVPGIALLESGTESGVADGDTTALRKVEHGSLPEEEAGGDAAEIAEFMQRHPETAELDDSRKNGIISDERKALSKIVSSEIPPMDKETFLKIKTSLLRKGIKMIQDRDGDAFLRFMGAEAMTLSDGSGVIFQSGRIPSASAVYEELIHIAQIKQKGAVSSDDVLEYLKREIEANEKVLKNKMAYKLTELDIRSIERNLDYYYKRLKEITDNVQDED